MSNLTRSAVKASAAKVRGDKVIDAKYLVTHQIVEQAIDVRENEGRESNRHPIQMSSGAYPKATLLFNDLLLR